MSGWTGLSLAGLQIGVASKRAGEHFPELLETGSLFPPAVVFSPGNPVRFHDRGPLPLPGAGLFWPTIARGGVEWADGAGRVPLAMVWQRLLSSDQAVGPETQPVRAARALALAARAVLGDEGHVTDETPLHVCMVVPDQLTEERQEELINACANLQIKLVLLWRPVAAAYSWLAEHSRHLLSEGVAAERSVGSLLTLHLGVDGFEGAWLELIHRSDEPDWILPARRRGRNSCVKVEGFQQLFLGAAECVFDGIEPLERHRAMWRALWASPTALYLFLGRRQQLPTSYWGLKENDCDRLRQAIRTAATEAVRGVAHLRGFGSTAFARAVNDWLVTLRAFAAEYPNARGAVVTGELAAFDLGGSTLGELIVKALSREETVRVELEGAGKFMHGSLARSAAVHAERRAAEKPTYLDTLPRIEVLVEERARPVWRPLLMKDEQYVDGGRPWRRVPDFTGLSLPAKAERLGLKVWLESEDKVKEVVFTLPEPPAARIAVKLRVEMEPAGGRACVRLLSDAEGGGLGRKEITLDWSRGAEVDGSREDVAENYERKCPDVYPRKAWRGGYLKVLSRLKPLMSTDRTALREAIASADARFDGIRDALNSTPDEWYQASDVEKKEGVGAQRAVDSNGSLHTDDLRYQHAFDEAVGSIAEVQLDLMRSGKQPTGVVLAVLGYACAQGQAIDEIITRLLNRSELNVIRDEATFLAGCIRRPEDAALYLRHLCIRMSNSWGGFNEVLKGAGYLLQWREHAIDEVSQDLALDLTFQARQLIAAVVDPTMVQGPRPPRARSKIKFVERNSLVLIAFLLRTRISDDSYLHPDKSEAQELKRVLVSALEKVRAGKLKAIDGMVQTHVLLERVIAYIDRRGSGTVIAD